MAKIHKYAHVFKRLLYRNRSQQSKTNLKDINEQDEEKYKMEMVMQLFRTSVRRVTQTIDKPVEEVLMKKSRRNALKIKQNMTRIMS